jgi:hypothetical protein
MAPNRAYRSLTTSNPILALNGTAGDKMKRIHVPGVVDVVTSDDRSEIEALAANPKLDRAYTDRSIPTNAAILDQLLGVLQVGGKRFPTVSPRDDSARAAEQDALWNRLNLLAATYAAGPDSLEDLASFVRGNGPDDAAGMLVQQVVGALFAPGFKATPESWDAALVLAQAPGNLNPLQTVVWAVNHKVDSAKVLLAGLVGGDLAAVHAIGIALHHIVSGVNLMRQLYADPANRTALSPDAASARCLFAPDSVLRQATAPDDSGNYQFDTGTLVQFKLQDASAKTPDADLAFLRNTWSRCPAEQWVPALLAGIWLRACQGGG